MATKTAAGPRGTGLIPPSNSGTPDNGGSDTEEENQDPPEPPQSENPPPNDDIDGVPPPEDDGGDDDDNDDGAGDGSTPPEGQEGLLDEVQKRFDRAVSRAVKGVEDRVAELLEAAKEPGSDDGGGENPPPPKSDTSKPQVDHRTLMVLARDRVADVMEDAGKPERVATKAFLDKVIPAIDWSKVGDEDKFIGELIETYADHSSKLIKAGSDRKVRQLRGMGLIPEAETQPGGGAGAGGRQPRSTPGDQMVQGQERAKSRWPEGKRRMGQ